MLKSWEEREERSGESRLSFLCYDARSVIGLNQIHVDVMLNKEAPEEASGVRVVRVYSEVVYYYALRW